MEGSSQDLRGLRIGRRMFEGQSMRVIIPNQNLPTASVETQTDKHITSNTDSMESELK